MPELPEVETVARGLQTLVGFHITEFSFTRHHLREPIPTDLIQTQFNNQTLAQVTRRGKYLLWHITHHHTTKPLGGLICHLGMSGIFSLTRCSSKPPILPKHTHWQVRLEDPRTHDLWLCYYTDPRRFGRLSLWQHKDIHPNHHPFIKSLGPEPLELTTTQLKDHLNHHRQRSTQISIKALLLNQTTVAGIGNIYANEALFKAKINPFRKACTLKQHECLHLANSIQTTLEHAIELGGTTLKNFKYLNGYEGLFAPECQVYNQHGQPCKHCGDTIVKTMQQQRATYLCPTCQPLPPLPHH